MCVNIAVTLVGGTPLLLIAVGDAAEEIAVGVGDEMKFRPTSCTIGASCLCDHAIRSTGRPPRRFGCDPSANPERPLARTLAMRGTQTSTDRVARQGLRSAVNFGVAALARALGAPASELLDLRCECGRSACTARVRISLREYDAAPLEDAVLVASGHAGPVSRQTVARSWVIVEGEAEQANPAGGSLRGRRHLMQARVLVAEDNPRLAGMVAAALRSEGYEVTVADDGVSALRLAASGGYDALLTDLRLPGLGGDELAARARDLDAGLPVLLMTAAADIGSARELPWVAVIRKPFRIGALLEAVDRALPRSARTSSIRSEERVAAPVRNEADSAPRRASASCPRPVVGWKNSRWSESRDRRR